MSQLISFFGLIVFIAFAYLISENRKAISLRVIIGGLALQLTMALFVLKSDFGAAIVDHARIMIQAILSLSDKGAEFVFGGDFVKHQFAFSVLPTIIFVSSLSYILFYYGILQRVVAFLAKIMQKVMGISGSESLCAAANIFIGQTEAPVLVKPYLSQMTRSEILAMMTSGMATVAGGVLAVFVKLGIPTEHLLAASLMSAPAALLIGKMILPETELSETRANIKIETKTNHVNVIDAACDGASEGLKLVLNVAAMLIAIISIVALVNMGLSEVGHLFGQNWSLEAIFSYLMYPVAYIMGVPSDEALIIGRLLGEKISINEFYAYLNLVDLINDGSLSERSITIATYALCGFANFSSIAIQVGGIGALVPERKKTLAKLGFKAFIGGNIAAFMTACFAGMLT